MEKIKFGIQLAILMLAFPVWFLTEMKDADIAKEKSRAVNEAVIEVKKTGSTVKAVKETADLEVTRVPVSKLMVTNI